MLREAEEEMKRAKLYYERKVPGLGDKFLDELELGFFQIQSNPERWPKMDQENRKYIIKRFPFKIIYRIDPNVVIIIAIAHHKQKPDYWRKRK